MRSMSIERSWREVKFHLWMPGSKRGAISKLVRNIPKETVNLQRQLCNSRDAGWKLGGRAGSVRVREQFFSLCISRARANTWSQIFPSGKLPSFDCDSDGGGGDFSPRMAASVTDCSMRSRQWLRRERSAVAKGSWRCYMYYYYLTVAKISSAVSSAVGDRLRKLTYETDCKERDATQRNHCSS